MRLVLMIAACLAVRLSAAAPAEETVVATSEPVTEAATEAQEEVDAKGADHAAASVAVGVALPTDAVQQIIRQYVADLATVDHRFQVVLDAERHQLRHHCAEFWLNELKRLDFTLLDRVGQIDYLLLRNKLEYVLAKLELDRQRDALAAEEFLPFAEALVKFCKAREDISGLDAARAAEQLDGLAELVERLPKRLNGNGSGMAEDSVPRRLKALRSVELLKSLRKSLVEADGFYQGYDPSYAWWCKQPWERLRNAIDQYTTYLQDRIVGVPQADDTTIFGLPLGAEGIALELRNEWIAHTPDELIAMAQREMAWCDQQLQLAAADLQCGDDWRKALEIIKARHVPPGKQPEMIRELAFEAIRFVESHNLLTIPPLAANGWRMTMMSPERQRLSPYFLGGETIIVSYPTDAMTHQEKLMSMRSNNQHFARATVHHELIPGHYMQYYMLARHRTYRSLFSTPFWMEGWALHWEMLLWDLDFPRGPEDRLGMLFWRKHRCARIVFSLNYHLGKMTPEQCIDYLVENVGHERSAAAAEIRRSVMGDYGPLYQAAYMLGGQQLRKLHSELVLGSGQMTQCDFHDAVLREHSIPIEILRAYLTNAELRADAMPSWRFADP
ncbi:MAG: DUF885 family protein [Pirellulaceae bacterium]|nr:DUF885 family protein [Pirellulaceae bacterium]